MARLVTRDESCWREASIDHAGVIIDACDYFRAFYREASRARHNILLAGWQFDSEVALLRGRDALEAAHPTQLLQFLSALCRERPELDVYILAWDYSAVFALEREWLQRAVFELNAPGNLHFRFDSSHPVGGSHHQKIATIDDAIAFSGGIDLARSRWDDRRHLARNPLRQEEGEPQKPYHDVMAYVTGEAARVAASVFRSRWEIASGDALAAPEATAPHAGIEPGLAVPIAADRVKLVRTRGTYGECDPCHEILRFYERAIAEAEHLVYAETQYFTARPILEALVARMQNRERGPLDVVVMLPDDADSEKEKVVLGPVQEQTLTTLERVAHSTGSRVRLLNTLAAGSEANPVATFIHSKILLVDDRIACVGSANLTNRSLLLDSELAFAWEATEEAPETARSIARLRSELLREHTGTNESEEFFRVEGLIDRLDRLLAEGTSRLRPRRRDAELLARPRSLHLERLFDPEKPLTDLELSELFSWPPPPATSEQEDARARDS
jgi:phospholipase D1/2